MHINQLGEVIKPLFPINAKLSCHEDVISISWKLNNDPYRKNKISVPINIKISDEFMEDYRDADELQKNKMLNFFNKLISEYVSNFSPNHNSQYGSYVPPVIWVVPTLH